MHVNSNLSLVVNTKMNHREQRKERNRRDRDTEKGVAWKKDTTQSKSRKIEIVEKRYKNTAGRGILEREQRRQREKRKEFHACPRELLSGSSTTGSLLPSKAAPYCTEISSEEVCVWMCVWGGRVCQVFLCMNECVFVWAHVGSCIHLCRGGCVCLSVCAWVYQRVVGRKREQ